MMTNIARLTTAGNKIVGDNTTWSETTGQFFTPLDNKAKALLKAEYAIMTKFDIPNKRSKDLRDILCELICEL